MVMEGLGKISAKVKLPWSQEILRLSPGQLLRARVLEASGKEALLLLAGRRLRVVSEVPLERGQELQLKVVGEGQGGALVLRVVADTFPSFARVNPAQIPLLLKGIGVKTTRGNIRLAAELIRQGFSVTAGTLQGLLSALGHPEPSPAEAKALVWLWGRGLPLRGPFLRSLVTLFQGEVPDLLQTVFPLVADGEGGGQDPGRLLLQQLLISPNRNGGKLLQGLPRLVGIDHEALLAQTLSSPTAGEGESVQPKVKRGSLKAFLLSLAQEKGDLPAELRGLLAEITGLQLLCAGTGSLHCLGWLELPPQALPFFLSVEEEEKGRGGGKSKGLALSLFLSLPALGPVLVELFCDGILTLSLTVEGEQARRVIEGCRQRLLAAMEDLPWRVQVLPCRLQERDTVREKWLRRIVAPDHLYQQVDVRV